MQRVRIGTVNVLVPQRARCLFHKSTASSPGLSLGSPRSSVASGAGLEPGAPRMKALEQDLRNGHLAKRGNDLLPKKFNGVPYQVLGHTADFMVGTEDIVPDALLAFFEFASDRFRAANDGESVLKAELVALCRH